MTDKQHAYDPDLPYVVEHASHVFARFPSEEWAEAFIEPRRYGSDYKIIDTTPAPRVPEDAKWITWFDSSSERHVAWRGGGKFRKWMDMGSYATHALEDLPGVTPDTVFTVLE